MGFLFAVIAGAAMSVQGVMNTRLSEKIGLYESNAWVQGTAFILSLLAVWILGKGDFAKLGQTPKYTLLGGALGTDPRRLPDYFAAHGVTCTPCRRDRLLGEGVFLCSYAALPLLREVRGVHTVALRVTAAGAAVWNERDGDTEPALYPDMPSFLKGKALAALYLLRKE